MKPSASRPILSCLLAIVLFTGFAPERAAGGVSGGILKDNGTEVDGTLLDWENKEIVKEVVRLLAWKILPVSNRLLRMGPEFDKNYYQKAFAKIALTGVDWNFFKDSQIVCDCIRKGESESLLIQDLPIGHPLNKYKTPTPAVLLCKQLIDKLYEFHHDKMTEEWRKGYIARSIVNEIFHHFNIHTSGGRADAFAMEVICENKRYSTEFGSYCTDQKISSVSLSSSLKEIDFETGALIESGAYWGDVHRKLFDLTTELTDKLSTVEEDSPLYSLKQFFTAKYTGIDLVGETNDYFNFKVDHIGLDIQYSQDSYRGQCSLTLRASVVDANSSVTDRVSGTVEVSPATRCVKGDFLEDDVAKLFAETLQNLRSETFNSARGPGVVVSPKVGTLVVDIGESEDFVERIALILESRISGQKEAWTPGYNSYFWDLSKSFSIAEDDGFSLNIPVTVELVELQFDGEVGLVTVEVSVGSFEGKVESTIRNSGTFHKLEGVAAGLVPSDIMLDLTIELIRQSVSQGVLEATKATCELQIDESGRVYLEKPVYELRGEESIKYLYQLGYVSDEERAFFNQKVGSTLIKEINRPLTELEMRYGKKCRYELDRMKQTIVYNLH